MNLKRGNIVSHTGMTEWGAGMIVELANGRATIQFSDGMTRKIAESHFMVLQPADPASYLPPEKTAPEPKKVRATRTGKKKTKKTLT